MSLATIFWASSDARCDETKPLVKSVKRDGGRNGVHVRVIWNLRACQVIVKELTKTDISTTAREVSPNLCFAGRTHPLFVKSINKRVTPFDLNSLIAESVSVWNCSKSPPKEPTYN